MSGDEYAAISSYVSGKIKEFGKNILDGDIKINPYETDKGAKSPCTYCEYRSICRYDEKVEGFSKRRLDISEDEARERILNEG